MQLEVMQTVFVFVVFAVAGWLLEGIYRSFAAGRPINPGLLAGPYLPIYGFGALLLNFVRQLIPDYHFLFVLAAISPYLPGADQLFSLKPLLIVINFTAKAIIYIFAATLLELFSGWALATFFKIRLWDYNGQLGSIRGYVCLRFSLYWAALAFALEYWLLPATMILYREFTLPAIALSLLLLEVIAIDFLIKTDRLDAGVRRKRKTQARVNELEFLKIAEPLLRHPLVSSLDRYRHHYHRNRLEHSLDVAWHSYRIARKLGLDVRMTVRGALLHDLFHYDWLHEGPRWHGFRHPRIALENAKKVIPLAKKEENIILRHMWPLTVIPPLYPEAWIVSTVDKYCGAKDYLYGTAMTLKKAVSTRIFNFLRW